MGYYFDHNVVASLPLDSPSPIAVISTAGSSSMHHQPFPATLKTMLVNQQDRHPAVHIAPSPPSRRRQHIRFSEATHTILHMPPPHDDNHHHPYEDDDNPAGATTTVHDDNDDTTSADNVDDTAILWYTPADLDHWRMTARLHCRAMRSSLRPGTCTLSVDPALRGLEQRACLERQRRRFLVTKCVLQQQRKRKSTQALAKMARQCTQYATQLAVEEAAKDYAEAYSSASDESSMILIEDRPPETSTIEDGPRLETTTLTAASTSMATTTEKRAFLPSPVDDAKLSLKRPPPCRC